MTAPGAPAAGVVALRGVTLHRAGAAVLRDLTATARPGAVTHLLGPAGAGKTAALRVLLGLATPTTGSATVDGAAVRDLPAPGLVVGLVPAGPALHPGRRGRPALRVLAAGLGVPDARVGEVLALVGLGPGGPGAAAAERRGRATPAPVRRRLAVAAALLGDPRVLLVDEPARDLDPAGAAWLHGLLRHLADAGRTVVVASRDPRDALAHDDPVVVLRGGACAWAGRARDLAAGEPVRVLAATRDPARLAGALVAAGTPDVRVLPDGRLEVTGARARAVAGVAAAAGVGPVDLREDLPDPERSYLRLTLGPAGPPAGVAGRAEPAVVVPPSPRRRGDDLAGRLLRAELRRVRSTRTAATLVLAAAPLAAAAAALVALATTLAAREALGPVALPPLQGLGAALGTQACTALAVCLGVVGATTEARGRGAVATALTAPGRGGVLLARAAVHAGLGLVLGVVAVLAATAGGTATAAALGGPAALPPPGALAGWLAADVLALGLWAVLGVGLGALVGRRGPGVGAALLLVWVVSPLLGLAGATVGRSGGPAVLAPTEAALALTRRRPLEALGRALADTVPGVTVDEAAWWWLGGVVLLAWVLAVGAAGWARTRRRDVV